MNENIEDIDNAFLVKTIDWNVKRYGHCPFIYIWLNTNVYEGIEENPKKYIKIHDILQNKLLEAKNLGLIIDEFSCNYDGPVWRLTKEGEYESLRSHKQMDALRDRTIKVELPCLE